MINEVEVVDLRPSRLPFKLGYLTTVNKIKKTLEEIKPDILHAHYASSYGLLGALSGFHPFIVSVWGSDVFSFPNKSPIHRSLLRYSLGKADAITSSSQVMAQETKKFVKNAPIDIIPFGVDTHLFNPSPDSKGGVFKIGTARSLKEIYGLEYLIKAFAKIAGEISSSKLEIVGEGPLKDKLVSLASSLGIKSKVDFLGYVEQEGLAKLLGGWSVAVLPSIRESFGVFALEASSSGLPVVASRVGGLVETVLDGKTGFLVEPKNVDELANKLLQLYKDNALREKLGKAGREFVVQNYDWEKAAPKMLEVYERVLKK